MQVKTTWYHSTPIKIAKTRTMTTDQDVEQQELLFTVVGMPTGIAILEDSLAVSYKAKHILTIWSCSSVSW